VIVEQILTAAPALSGSYKHLAALGTSAAIKSGAGVLIGVVVNSKGATANTLTLYDSLLGSGTVIAVIDTTAGPATLPYNLAFTVGLSAVLASGTAADVTLVWQ
jgi:hypothetical protein